MARLALDDATCPFNLGLARGVHAQYLRGIAYRGERVAQLMRQHRQQLVLALTYLAQRFFCLTALSDVEADSYDITVPRRACHPRLRIYPTLTAHRMVITIFELAMS